MPDYKIDFGEIKQTACGRWAEIIPSLTALNTEVLVKGTKDHPCPNCNGESVIWPARNANDTGSIACRNCTNGRPTGDGIATVAKFSGKPYKEAAEAVALFLGIEVGTTDKDKKHDIIEAVCRDNRMPLNAFLQFNPSLAKRGRSKSDVVRVPTYNEKGETHSYFDFAVGQKGWCKNGKGNSGMFFPGRLPQPNETWHIVEGGKDAAALIGLGFNACGLPSSCMAEKYARLFKDVHVILVPDLDSPGQLGAQVTGGRLSGIAASVQVARLPGEIVKKGGDDVRDILARPDGEQLVRSSLSNLQPWQAREGEIDPKEGRPEVLVSLAYGWCVDQVVNHLAQLGWNSPWIPESKRERLKLFQRGGVLVQVIKEDQVEIVDGIEIPAGTPRIRALPYGQLVLRITDACQLIQESESDGEVERTAVPPQRWLVEGVFSRGEYGREMKRLMGIVTAPTLRADGTIIQIPGYDERTGLLYQPTESFPKVPENPSREHAQAAANELLRVVKDFQFQNESDRSAWLAMVLSLIARSAIPGCVPLFALSAFCPGSGKTLSADSASYIAFGRKNSKKTFSANEEETRKAITAVAMEALPSVLLDNVDIPIGGAALDAALTATVWKDRILGKSENTEDLPLRTVWLATGNNLRFRTDLARRVIPIRFTPTVENPEERTGFEHPDLMKWVIGNRPRLAVAALTVLRAYFCAGKPPQPNGQFGSFESWSELVRGAIVWAGLPDPLATRETAKAEDSSGAIVRGLIGGLLEIDEDGDGLTARQIVMKLNATITESKYPTMREVVSEVATRKGIIDVNALGVALRKYRGRIANGYQLDGIQNRSKVVVWTAKRMPAGDAGDAGDVTSARSFGSSVCYSNTQQDVQATHTNSDIEGLVAPPASPASPALPESLPHEVIF